MIQWYDDMIQWYDDMMIQWYNDTMIELSLIFYYTFLISSCILD